MTNTAENMCEFSANVLLVKNAMNELEIIKSFDSKVCPDIHLKLRFINEFRILKKLNHHRLPNVKNLIYHSDQMSMKYPYIHGCTLRQVMTKHHANFSQAAIIIIQLLEILEYLHSDSVGIIHSDIHPDNLIYSDTGKIYLIDFGCAHKITRSRPMAATWIGCHAYLSPEQAQGRQWNLQSDLYQVGLVMYELMNGQRFNQGLTKRQQIPFAANPVNKHRYHPDKKINAYLEYLLTTETSHRYSNAAHARLQLLKLISSYKNQL